MTHKHISLIIAAILTTVTVAVLLFSPRAGAEDSPYPPSFSYGQAPDVPLEELGPKYHFLDKLEPGGITHMWILESNNDDGTHTINFFPEQDIGKSEMQSAHLTACVLASYFDGFTLKGTAFYLPNGLLFGSPCIRPDGKGFKQEEWGGNHETT